MSEKKQKKLRKVTREMGELKPIALQAFHELNDQEEDFYAWAVIASTARRIKKDVPLEDLLPSKITGTVKFLERIIPVSSSV